MALLDSTVVSLELQQLLQLFSSLPDVRFPQFEPLELQQAVTKLQELHLDVQKLEAQLEAARLVLSDEQDALLRRAHRLFAYLQVFVQSDEVLAQKLAAISLPRPKRVLGANGDAAVAVEGKKRGRPRKVPLTDGLFAAVESAEATASIS